MSARAAFVGALVVALACGVRAAFVGALVVALACGARAAFVGALVVALACGSAGRRDTVDLAPFFEAEGVADARREAPDLVAAAELAREEAERADAAGDADAASDHATRARLWLDAALVEAERVRLDRERIALLDEAEAALDEARALETAREAIATRARREAAAEVARVQMQNAHAAAERLESRGRRHRGADVDRTRREAAAALEGRARLLVAAARALGASDEELAPFEGEPERPSDPAAWLAQADETHRRALALLGRRRAAHPVGPEVVASLVEAARERSLTPVLTPEGLAIAVSDPSNPRSGAASERALVDLARAFPHGLVVLRGRGASARQRRLASALPEAPARFEAEDGTTDPDALFTAYGTASASSTAPSATNGASTNGASTNGASTNGASTNGASTNGASTNGASTNGAASGEGVAPRVQ